MNIDKITEAELKQKVMKMMEDADDKVEAIYQAAAMIVEEKNKELINQLVEQNARAALKLASRGYVLEVGNVAMEDTAANLLDDASVREAYLGG